jgi:kynureninase
VPSERARDLDAADELAHFRTRFCIEDEDLIYLDGNSLGRMPTAAAERVSQLACKEWGCDLVRGWADWFDLPERLGAKIATLIGAQPDEVIVSDSTTVNLYKLVSAALKSQGGRNEVVTDSLNFPSDLYAISSVLQNFGPGRQLRVCHSADQISIQPQELKNLLDQNTALLTTSHTSFKSGFVHDMKAVTDLAHDAGALALWDLSHSVGALPVDLNGSGADMAVGCTYKYLNGGPGAPAFLYIRKDIQQKLESPIWGWFGQNDPFAFDMTYSAHPKLRKFLVGTPPILSLAAIEPGVDMVIEAGIEKLRSKSVRQTEFLIDLWEQHLQPLGVTLNSPRESSRRGSHVSFGHPDALRIDKALIEDVNVIPDFRAPNNIRFGVTPLYTTYRELEEGVLRFKQVLVEKLYERHSRTPTAVT